MAKCVIACCILSVKSIDCSFFSQGLNRTGIQHLAVGQLGEGNCWGCSLPEFIFLISLLFRFCFFCKCIQCACIKTDITGCTHDDASIQLFPQKWLVFLFLVSCCCISVMVIFTLILSSFTLRGPPSRGGSYKVILQIPWLCRSALNVRLSCSEISSATKQSYIQCSFQAKLQNSVL